MHLTERNLAAAFREAEATCNAVANPERRSSVDWAMSEDELSLNAKLASSLVVRSKVLNDSSVQRARTRTVAAVLTSDECISAATRGAAGIVSSESLRFSVYVFIDDIVASIGVQSQ
jgi:hypothetical protein